MSIKGRPSPWCRAARSRRFGKDRLADWLAVGFTTRFLIERNASLIAGRFWDHQPTASCFGNGCLAIQGAGFDGFLIGNTGTVSAGLRFDVSSAANLN